jgi:gluconokinase
MKVGNERSIVVMGVSGSGKSTIARALATRLEVPFIDGDSLHSPYNIVKMSNGQALSDADRAPWLHLIGQRFKDEASTSNGCVVACSALTRKYRDVLREYLPDAFFVVLYGSSEKHQESPRRRYYSREPSLGRPEEGLRWATY